VALPAGPALAHVTIQSPGASQGGYAKVTFRVPAEKPLATTRLQVVFPADAPLGSVRVKPHPGPLRVSVRPTHRSPGHYEDLGVVLPARGTWQLPQIRTNDVDSYPATQTITVR
jgi:hypothetical protein